MAFPLSSTEHATIKGRIETQEELIIAAAVRYDGAVVMVERPGRHGDCINWLSYHAKGRDQYDCGFLTNRGRFVDREEAGRIVRAAGQGSAGGTPANNPRALLYSEDMWNDCPEGDGVIDPAAIF